MWTTSGQEQLAQTCLGSWALSGWERRHLQGSLMVTNTTCSAVFLLHLLLRTVSERCLPLYLRSLHSCPIEKTFISPLLGSHPTLLSQGREEGEKKQNSLLTECFTSTTTVENYCHHMGPSAHPFHPVLRLQLLFPGFFLSFPCRENGSFGCRTTLEETASLGHVCHACASSASPFGFCEVSSVNCSESAVFILGHQVLGGKERERTAVQTHLLIRKAVRHSSP